MGNYDKDGSYIPNDSEIEPTRLYCEEELAERAEWREMMSELAALVCAPVIDED